MPEEIGLGSAKRFGARYGRTVKHKFAKIEALQRKKYKCPYCSYDKVKRLSSGIWHCRKCNAKFTNKAYTIEEVKIKEEIFPEEGIKEEAKGEIKEE